jgi:tetratricopeptide (TPR) repeat protein
MKINNCLATVMTLFCIGPAALADDLAEGKNLYSKGEYNKAAEVFKRAIQKNGRNSTAHYYMANCYVAKHDWGEAKSEYKYAADLTNDDKIRDYCMTVIANIEASHPSSSSSSGSGSQYGSGGPSSFDKAAARGQSVMNKSQSEAKFVMEQAERECAAVAQERSNALSPFQGFNVRSQTAVSSEEEREQVAAPYNKRIDDIRNRAKSRVDGLMRQGEEAARSAALQ